MTAARENAEWCDLFCRCHGVRGSVSDGMWASPCRTPDLYPDAVVLDPSVTARDVLGRIDAGPGASVKDSFGSVDLGAAGFRRLFDAQWLWRDGSRPPPAGTAGWSWAVVADPSALASWERGWSQEQRSAGFFPVGILGCREVQLVAAHGGPSIVAGMVVHRSRTVVGISNVFDRTGDPEATWADAVRQALRLTSGLPLVGYERGRSQEIASGLGFEAVGSLTGWMHDDGSESS
jgi:hypothetical protein